MARVKITGIDIWVDINVLDTEDAAEAVASLSLRNVPAWLYTIEARRLGKVLIKLADQADARAVKRTAMLKKHKKTNRKKR